MDNLAKKLNIVDHSKWYQVTFKVLREEGAGTLLAKYDGSPSKLLQAVYPEYPSLSYSFIFIS